MPQPIAIHSPYIKLDSLLKLANLCMSGGEAKTLILDGKVSVNGSVCLQRGKKIIPGDVVECLGQGLKVTADET